MSICGMACAAPLQPTAVRERRVLIVCAHPHGHMATWYTELRSIWVRPGRRGVVYLYDSRRTVPHTVLYSNWRGSGGRAVGCESWRS